MARTERDREDLLAEATALVERIELALPGWAEHVIAGFRANGCGSLYFGPDEAYQFNMTGELRRAYRDGALYKAERGALVRLTRQRTSHEVQLVRHDMDAGEAAEFLRRMKARLDALERALITTAAHHIVGQVPSDLDLVAKVVGWLGWLPRDKMARTPHAT